MISYLKIEETLVISIAGVFSIAQVNKRWEVFPFSTHVRWKVGSLKEVPHNQHM